LIWERLPLPKRSLASLMLTLILDSRKKGLVPQFKADLLTAFINKKEELGFPHDLYPPSSF